MGFNLLPGAARRHAEHGQDQRRRLQALRPRVRGAGRRLLTVLAFDFDFRPTTTMLNVAASLPLLLAYPLAVGIATYRLAPGARPEPHAGGAQPHRRPLGAPQPHLVGADRVRRDGALRAQPPRRVAADDRRRSLQADQRPVRASRGRPGDPERRRDREPDGPLVGHLRPLRRRGVQRRAARHRRGRRCRDRRAHSPADRGDDGRAGGRHPVHREHRHRCGAAGRRGRRRLRYPRRPRAVR